MSSVKYWVKAAEEFPVVLEDDMLRKTVNESSEPVVEGAWYKPAIAGPRLRWPASDRQPK